MHHDKYGELMDSSIVARFRHYRLLGRLFAFLMIPFLWVVLAQPANAVGVPVTKKCTTTQNGTALPWYYTNSMAVSREYVSGKWRFRVETSPKRTVTYNTGGGSYNSTRYVQHHIDTVKMYDSSGLRVGKTVNWPGTVTYFYSSYSGMDFYMKAHVTNKPFAEKFPTCRIYF